MTSARCGVFSKALLATYIVAAALLPLTHHDVACHFKSSTHCTTCVVASSGEAAPWAVALDGMRLADAGRAILSSAACCQSAPTPASSGRSPPLVG